MSHNFELRLIDLISDQAEQALARQNKDGSMPSGCNGPYKNSETPVRNTAHWLMTFSYLYRSSRDQRYLDAAERLASYLADPGRRPYNYSFHCRDGTTDHCNGVMGQAWAMEGLAEATRLFCDDRFAQIALQVFYQHEFDHRHGLWLRLEPDGRVIGKDPTFNHQLWFAASAAELLASVDEIDHPSLKRFMQKLNKSFAVLDNGHIRHGIDHAIPGGTVKKLARPYVHAISATFRIKSLLERIDRRQQNALLREIGYQSFTIYAFARLARIFKQHPVFISKPFRHAMCYLESQTFKREIRDNLYGYGYNAPGFEVPLCLSAFSSKNRPDILQEARYWIESQLSKTYNPETHRFDRNTDDPESLSARIYECVRFPEDILALKVNYGATLSDPHR